MRISVAIATYNGEKYIKEQLESIMRQTEPVDEIIISDDGSTDFTIQIISDYLQSKNTFYRIIKNEGYHGPSGNFENALRNCSGDYIFLSDQDDVWLEDKVKSVMDVFRCNPELQMVFHDLKIIDRNGEFIATDYKSPEYVNGKLPLDPYLEMDASTFLCNGMVMCISRALLEIAFPFPEGMYGGHDQWITFCALAVDQCYHLPEVLTLYRLHGGNTCGNSSVYRGNFWDKWKRVKSHVKSSSQRNNDMYCYGLAMQRIVDIVPVTDPKTVRTVRRIIDIGGKMEDAYQSMRILGLYKLLRLYKNDIRYRRTGFHSFFYDMLGICFNYNKGKRK